MKKLMIFGLICIIALPLLIVGCTKTTTPTNNSTTIPTNNTAANEITIDLSLADFEAQNIIIKTIELNLPGSLTVRLGSNASTGFEWGDSVINNTGVIKETVKDSVPPTNTNLVGAPGTDVRVYSAVGKGTATINLSYSRPWENGEKDIYTLTINVTVK
jgi:predicted secreted protein